MPIYRLGSSLRSHLIVIFTNINTLLNYSSTTFGLKRNLATHRSADCCSRLQNTHTHGFQFERDEECLCASDVAHRLGSGLIASPSFG